MKTLQWIITTFTLTALLSAAESTDALVKIIENIEAKIDALPENDNPRVLHGQSAAKAGLEAVKRTKLDQILETHRSRQQDVDRVASVLRGEDLVIDLREELSRLEKEAVASKKVEFNSFVADVKMTLLNSEKPKDLDELLLKLVNFQFPKYTDDPEIKKYDEHLRNMKSVTVSWQDYLMAEQRNDSTKCKSALEQISRQLTNYPFIPRSYVLNKLNPPPKPPTSTNQAGGPASTTETESANDDVLPTLTSLQNKLIADPNSAEEILAYLQRLSSSDLSSNDLRDFKSSLEKMIKNRYLGPKSDHHSHLAKILGNSSYSSSGDPAVTAIIEREQLEVVKEVFPWPANVEFPETHSPLSYLGALIDEYRKEGNYRKVLETLPTYRAIMSKSRSSTYYSTLYSSLQTDQSSIQNYLEAQVFESAGHISEAIKAYTSAISRSGSLSPLDESAAALKRLSESFPDIFKIATAPSPPRSFDPRMDPRYDRHSSRDPRFIEMVNEAVSSALLKKGIISPEKKVLKDVKTSPLPKDEPATKEEKVNTPLPKTPEQ